MAVDLMIDFLRVADEYLLDELKNIAQAELIELIDEDTYQTIYEMGELYNGERIVEYCQWFKRRKISQYSHGDTTFNSAAYLSSDSIQSFAPLAPSASLITSQLQG